jgi:predicted amidohydrolase
MKTFGFQFDIAWENKETNFTRVRELVDRARPEEGSLLVLPEMFATGFSMNVAAIAEEHEGPTEAFLSGLARERSCWVMGGAAVRSGDGLVRNKCLVLSPEGRLAAYYAKMRPFSPGGEKDHYTAGEKIMTFDWQQCKVASFICYDLRFPELFLEAVRLCRPQLLTVIASWPSKRASHWRKLLQARAIENQAYVIGVNRTGTDPFYSYSGGSVIVDPQGEVVSDAGEKEGFVSAELDLTALAKYREGLPFLDDM